MREVFGQAERLSCTPTGMKQFFVLNIQSDVRATLDLVKAPTIIFHARGDRQVPYEAGQHLAENIEDAKLVTLEGDDHVIWAGDISLFIEEINKACAGETQSYSVSSRVLATVLFTDIVNSTGQLAIMGDENWRNLLDKHDDIAIELVERFQGKLVKSTGDGLLATFDGPGRAIQCAQALVEQMSTIEISIRAAMHTGEIEQRKDDISGLAVHVAARILGFAGGGEVLMSKLVTDLVSGSGKFSFESLGAHELKGFSEEFELLKCPIN
jgi:class 3 adenylate cyclase